MGTMSINGLLVSLLSLLTVCWAQLTQTEIDIFKKHGVNVTVVDSTKWIFAHNAVPKHEFGPFNNKDNPNTVTTQNNQFHISRQPKAAASAGCLPMGAMAVAINGVPIYNPYSALGYNAVEGAGAEVFDKCKGHPQPNGEYHYHQLPVCLYEDKEDQLLGVAFDGYPIYGPKTQGGKDLTSADLDKCHGQTRNGKYEYRITADFPYVMGCYKGVHWENTKGGSYPSNGMTPPPKGGNGPPPGGMQTQTWSSCYAECENPVKGCPPAGSAAVTAGYIILVVSLLSSTLLLQ